MVKKIKSDRITRTKVTALIFVILFAGVGAYLIFHSKALSPYLSVEAENGTLSGGASLVTDNTASGGTAVDFGGNPNQILSTDPLAQQTPIDQGSYFKTYGFITSIDLMKITRDRSFPSLADNVIQSDVQTFAAQLPNANTMTDDIFFDNVTGFQQWADAIHAAGKHVWYRGHFCNWEPVTQCGNVVDNNPTDYVNKLTTFLSNPAVEESIQSGDVFDPCSEPVDQLGSDTTDLNKILLYTTKAAHNAFVAQGKNVLIVHSLSESSFTNQVISSNVLQRMGSLITIDSYPEDALSGTDWSGSASTAATDATQSWTSQLNVISNNYSSDIKNNDVKILIGEAGFPNDPSGVSDAVKSAVNQSNFTMFMSYPDMAGTNYWVGPGDDNAGGHTYLFSPQTNFDSVGWTINSTGQAINSVYGNKLGT